MKRLFLASQVHIVAKSIAARMDQNINNKMVFINTCVRDKIRTNEGMEWHEKNKSLLKEVGFHYDIYDIADKTNQQLHDDLDKYDIMYVECGNTFYLLCKSQENDFSSYIQKRIGEGMIYIGTSAGSIIAGPDTVSGSRPGKSPSDYKLSDTTGFHLVNFVVMPHWGDQSKKDMYKNFKIPIAYSHYNPYILLTDNQYVEVTDDWYKIVDITKE